MSLSTLLVLSCSAPASSLLFLQLGFLLPRLVPSLGTRPGDMIYPRERFGVEDLALYIVSHFESVIDISAFTDGERATENATTCLVLCHRSSLVQKTHHALAA